MLTLPVSQEDTLKKREDYQVSLRNKKKNEMLMRKRRAIMASSDSNQSEYFKALAAYSKFFEKLTKATDVDFVSVFSSPSRTSKVLR